MLLKGLGNGHAEIAMNRLLLLRRSNQDDAEIVAAFASIGFDTDGATVLERLDNIAVTHYVDARTVRRWSDAGLSKLALLVLGVGPWIDPQIELVLYVEPERAICTARATIPLHIGMYPPKLSFDDTEVDLKWKRVEAPAGEPERYRADPVEFSLAEGSHLAHLEWRGEISPTYIAEARRLDGWGFRVSHHVRALRVYLNRVDSDAIGLRE